MAKYTREELEDIGMKALDDFMTTFNAGDPTWG